MFSMAKPANAAVWSSFWLGCFNRDLNLRSHILLDLEWFSKLVTTGSDKLFSLPFESNFRGLSGLTEMVLGKALDKRDQISDWSRRPLTDEQV